MRGERGFPREHRSRQELCERPRSSLTLREGDDGQGEGEQRQGAEVHAGAAGGRGQALLCSSRRPRRSAGGPSAPPAIEGPGAGGGEPGGVARL